LKNSRLLIVRLISSPPSGIIVILSQIEIN